MCGIGINRNIVECKVSFFKGFVVASMVLIETLWNVKRGGSYIKARTCWY